MRPADVVDGHPALTLQLVYAIATYAQLKDWNLKPPPLEAGSSDGSRPLTRRVLNWRCLRDALVAFTAPRVASCGEILTVPAAASGGASSGGGLKVLPDLGPCLMDGRVLLALMHATDPQQCPYDPLGSPAANAGSGSGLGSGLGLEDNRSSAERFERNRRRAFARANHVFGVPPLLSDAAQSPLPDAASRGSVGGGGAVGGVGLESAGVAFRFEHLGMLYLSELCARLGKATAVSKDAAAVAALAQQLDAASRRER